MNSFDTNKHNFFNIVTRVISENVDDLLIFREKSSMSQALFNLDSGHDAIYIHWTCINVKKENVHT